jgi:murein DD-endopeptidase MepM/ murein hydrolase activator NlpD
VPGGVALVPLPGRERPREVRFRGERVLVRQIQGRWTAVVGLPLAAKPGVGALEADGQRVAFTVKPKRYPEQRLKVAPNHVNPDPEEGARIVREQALMAPVWKLWPEGLIPGLGFRQPTPGALSGSFGLRRFFNGEARAPHAGLDIAAPQGQPVMAPAAGVVQLTGDFFFSGHTVMVVHGEGVVSLLCHLVDITVKEGQRVEVGDLIGHVGKTGRATGPHLHWTLSLNNARVDPRLFLE